MGWWQDLFGKPKDRARSSTGKLYSNVHARASLPKFTDGDQVESSLKNSTLSPLTAESDPIFSMASFEALSLVLLPDQAHQSAFQSVTSSSLDRKRVCANCKKAYLASTSSLTDFCSLDCRSNRHLLQYIDSVIGEHSYFNVQDDAMADNSVKTTTCRTPIKIQAQPIKVMPRFRVH